MIFPIKTFFMKTIFSLTAIFFTLQAFAQSSLVMNGASIQLKNGAYLVINNNQPAGITILNTTNGITNDASSFVRWNIGTNSSTYTTPFYFNGNYIPLSFTTSGAAGSGYFDLGTYNVPTWKNSDYLPTGVSNVNRNGSDNSNHLIDRFWSILAGGYATKPMLSNVQFTYQDEEWNAAGNSMAESLLGAQRWNGTLSKWSDYGPAGAVNTSTNTITIANVPAADVFQWWTLVDVNYPLPLQLLTFKAAPGNNMVKLEWSTTSEINTKEFVIERSADKTSFVPIGAVSAAGNSIAARTYSAIDSSPLPGLSFYRLKMIDIDGHFTYSPIAVINVTKSKTIIVFPNPVRDELNINLGTRKANSFVLMDAGGQIIRRGLISSQTFQIGFSNIEAGTYILKLFTTDGIENLKIIKQ
jgi:hypothetical protein